MFGFVDSWLSFWPPPNTRKEVWGSLSERAHESVEATGHLAQTQLLYWQDRLEAIVSLVGTIYRHPEDYTERKMLWSPFGFFYSRIEPIKGPRLFYAPSSENILPSPTSLDCPTSPPFWQAPTKAGGVHNVWIVLRNRASIVYPGVDHEKLAKESVLDLKNHAEFRTLERIGTHQASEPHETLLKNALEAHGFFMPNPQQPWRFELAEAL